MFLPWKNPRNGCTRAENNFEAEPMQHEITGTIQSALRFYNGVHIYQQSNHKVQWGDQGPPPSNTQQNPETDLLNKCPVGTDLGLQPDLLRLFRGPWSYSRSPYGFQLAPDKQTAKLQSKPLRTPTHETPAPDTFYTLQPDDNTVIP